MPRTAAWRRLHRRYYPIAGAFLRKLGVRERDLEDATQEVFDDKTIAMSDDDRSGLYLALIDARDAAGRGLRVCLVEQHEAALSDPGAGDARAVADLDPEATEIRYFAHVTS